MRDRQFVNGLARGLEVLRAFRPDDGPLGNHDLAERTGLPRSTVSRLSYTLTSLGYLSYSTSLGKYALATPVLSLGYACLAGMSVRDIARPLMHELAQQSGASVALGGRDRLSMLYIECCRPDAAVTLKLEVGSRIPIATTSMGRALLAALPKDERDSLLEEVRRGETDRWSQILDGVRRAADELRATGFVTALGEWNPDVNGVGVPFVPVDGSPVLAFNCGGPSFLFSASRLRNDIGPRLVQLVRQVLGASGVQEQPDVTE